jgi:hypothetical protein
MFNYYDYLSSKENINSLLDYLVIQVFYVHLHRKVQYKCFKHTIQLEYGNNY